MNPLCLGKARSQNSISTNTNITTVCRGDPSLKLRAYLVGHFNHGLYLNNVNFFATAVPLMVIHAREARSFSEREIATDDE